MSKTYQGPKNPQCVFATASKSRFILLLSERYHSIEQELPLLWERELFSYPETKIQSFWSFTTCYQSLCFLFLRFKGTRNPGQVAFHSLTNQHHNKPVHSQMSRLSWRFPGAEKTLGQEGKISASKKKKKKRNPSALPFLGLQKAPVGFIPGKPESSICFVDFTTPFVLLQTFQRPERHYYLVKSQPKSFLQPGAVLTWVEPLSHKRIAFVPRSSHWLSGLCTEPIRS